MHDSKACFRAFGAAVAITAITALPALAGDTFLQDTESFDVDRPHTTGVLRDDQLITRNLVLTVPPSGLPEAADLDAYAVMDDGTVFFSTDLSDWSADLNDNIPADGGGTTSRTFDLAAFGIEDEPVLFFRVEPRG